MRCIDQYKRHLSKIVNECACVQCATPLKITGKNYALYNTNLFCIHTCVSVMSANALHFLEQNIV